MNTVPLRYLAEINPPTPAFDVVTDNEEIGFLPLEAVWSDARADHSRRVPKRVVATGYTRYQAGDVVCPKVTPTFQAGRSMMASTLGAGTTELHILRPRDGVDARWIVYALRSKHFLDEGVTAFQGVAGLQRVPAEYVAAFRVVDLPTEEQRRIADFLDDRVARIDQIIAARERQIEGANAASLRASFDTIRGFHLRERRPSGLRWLGEIPQGWGLCSVTSEFQVDLGKMLDEKRQTGLHPVPYLRNTNVQWDWINLEDLKSMDIAPEERPRYTVEPGDLLICEGGQPGRAAIWRGGLEPLGFQKALHRARSRGRSRVEWLLECLRAATAMNVFAVEYEQATISHLTNEQLRAFKIPCPDPTVQDALLADLRRTQEWARLLAQGYTRSIELLTEYEQSLITAAVTGELDVVTASSGIPG